MSDGSSGGLPIIGGDRPARAFKKGRTCNEAGCGTQLSIYNDGKYCFLHEPMSVPRTRGKKIA